MIAIQAEAILLGILLVLFGAATARRRARSHRYQDSLLTGREAAARHMFGEAHGWGAWSMELYDSRPGMQKEWLKKADRRLSL